MFMDSLVKVKKDPIIKLLNSIINYSSFINSPHYFSHQTRTQIQNFIRRVYLLSMEVFSKLLIQKAFQKVNFTSFNCCFIQISL